MLILTRRVGESIMIGDDITITTLGVRGSQVRLGVNAPEDVPVHREEIYLRIQQEQTREQISEAQRELDELRKEREMLDT